MQRTVGSSPSTQPNPPAAQPRRGWGSSSSALVTRATTYATQLFTTARGLPTPQQSTPQRSPIGELSDILLNWIFRYLSAPECADARRVCKRWQTLLSGVTIWESHWAEMLHSDSPLNLSAVEFFRAYKWWLRMNKGDGQLYPLALLARSSWQDLWRGLARVVWESAADSWTNEDASIRPHLALQNPVQFLMCKRRIGQTYTSLLLCGANRLSAPLFDIEDRTPMTALSVLSSHSNRCTFMITQREETKKITRIYGIDESKKATLLKNIDFELFHTVISVNERRYLAGQESDELGLYPIDEDDHLSEAATFALSGLQEEVKKIVICTRKNETCLIAIDAGGQMLCWNLDELDPIWKFTPSIERVSRESRLAGLMAGLLVIPKVTEDDSDLLICYDSNAKLVMMDPFSGDSICELPYDPSEQLHKISSFASNTGRRYLAALIGAKDKSRVLFWSPAKGANRQSTLSIDADDFALTTGPDSTYLITSRANYLKEPHGFIKHYGDIQRWNLIQDDRLALKDLGKLTVPLHFVTERDVNLAYRGKIVLSSIPTSSGWDIPLLSIIHLSTDQFFHGEVVLWDFNKRKTH